MPTTAPPEWQEAAEAGGQTLAQIRRACRRACAEMPVNVPVIYGAVRTSRNSSFSGAILADLSR